MRSPLIPFALPALLMTSPLAAAPSPYPFSAAVQAGDMLYLSGQIGVAPDTGRLVAGGVAAETRQAMANIGATLRQHQLDYRHLVKCMIMLTDMAQWPELNRVYAAYFPDGQYPARSAIGASALALGAQVEIECMARVPHKPESVASGRSLGPYSQAVRSGGTVYLSGVVPYDAEAGRFASPDIESQMRQLFANLDATLGAAGLTRSDVVKTTLFLRNPGDMARANAAYADYFSAALKPARTAVSGVDWGRDDLIVEMDAVAVAGGHEGAGR